MNSPQGWVRERTTTMTGLLIVFLSIAAYSPLTPPSFAQSSCVDPANLCEQWWDAHTSKWIQNPDCSFINHAFLQSDTPSSGPAEGLRVNPVGQPCGAQVGHFNIPCGVKTTTNTCADSTPPPGYCPVSDPSCLCDPADPNCGGGGGVCDPHSPAWNPYACNHYSYSAGRLDGKTGNPCDSERNPCHDGANLVIPVPRGNPGLEVVLRRAALISPLPQSVSTLLQELAQAHGIYLKAKMSFLNSADGTRTTGSYEYWERDGRYRIRIDPAFNFAWTDVAFDGEFVQGRDGVETVEIRRGDDRFTPLPDGPLTLALAPLRVNDSADCPACQLRLADLKRAVQWRRDAAHLASSEGASVAGTFDAGAQRSGESDAEGRLVRLVWPPDQTSAHNRLEVTLSDHQPIEGASGAVFPMRLTERLTPEGLAPEISVTYTVEKIDLSPIFRDDVFDIRSKARKVLYGFVDKNGEWHGHYVRWAPTPGLTCDRKQ